MNTPSLLRRFAAISYDTLILLGISMLYGFIATGINYAINGAPETGERLQWGCLEPLIFLGWLASQIFYYVYFWHKVGQTVGMKTWRVRILGNDGKYLSYPKATLRALLALASFACVGLGYWYALISRDKQTLHDHATASYTQLLDKHK